MKMTLAQENYVTLNMISTNLLAVYIPDKYCVDCTDIFLWSVALTMTNIHCDEWPLSMIKAYFHIHDQKLEAQNNHHRY